jgi:hypothetical protein
MLMGNHGSHCTAEFIALANADHIRPIAEFSVEYTLPDSSEV